MRGIYVHSVIIIRLPTHADKINFVRVVYTILLLRGTRRMTTMSHVDLHTHARAHGGFSVGPSTAVNKIIIVIILEPHHRRAVRGFYCK